MSISAILSSSLNQNKVAISIRFCYLAHGWNFDEGQGYHEVKFDGSGLSSGVYFYRIEVRPLDSAIGRDSKSGAGSFVQTRKLLLLTGDHLAG